MGAIIALNVVLVLLFAIAGTIYFNWDGDTDRFENGVAFLFSGALAVGISIFGWVIYAIYHFYVLASRLVDKI